MLCSEDAMRWGLLAIAVACKGGATGDSGTRIADTDPDADTDADADADTPSNDDFASAADLGLRADETVHAGGAIEVPGDVDFYKFDAVSGHDYVFYLSAGAGPLDPQLSIFGPDQTLYAENNDLPYHLSKGDAGLEIRPPTGTYYLEIEAYWADSTDPEPGGATYAWTLDATDTTDPRAPDEDANGDDDDAAEAATNLIDHDGDGYPDSPWSLNPWVPGPIAWAAGDLAVPGDEDWLWIGVGAIDDQQVCQFSLFPGAPTALDPVFELYREPCAIFGGDCTGADPVLVASTDDPWFHSDASRFFEDPGIAYPVSLAGMYYLRIADQAGGSGADHWYSAIQYCDQMGEAAIEDGRVDLDAAQLLTVTGSEARVAGFLDGAEIGAPDDPQDAFLFEADPPSGSSIVRVDTVDVGSHLHALVSVYQKNGPGDYALLDTIDGDDPEDFAVVPGNVPIVVAIESATGAAGPDQYYFLRIAPQPVY
jgi:hypothetical protein